MKTQIWTAVAVYTLIAIIKKRMKIDLSLYTILQILSLTLFEKLRLEPAFTETEYTNQITTSHIQMKLFES
jgi:hypothetical protein